MPLSAGSKQENIEKSLNTYVRTALVTGEGLEVHFLGDRTPFQPTGARWVLYALILGLRRQPYSRVAEGDESGNIVTCILNFNCCELVAQRTNRYSLTAVRDKVRGRFLDGKTTIPIRDYATVGTPIVDHFPVLSLTETLVSDGFGPNDNGVCMYNLSAYGEYIEAYS